LRRGGGSPIASPGPRDKKKDESILGLGPIMRSSSDGSRSEGEEQGSRGLRGRRGAEITRTIRVPGNSKAGATRWTRSRKVKLSSSWPVRRGKEGGQRRVWREKIMWGGKGGKDYDGLKSIQKGGRRLGGCLYTGLTTQRRERA